MVLLAATAAIAGVILKLIAAEPAGWFLVPLAMAASAYHVGVHARAARTAYPPVRLAMNSNVLLFAAIILQIDFGWTYNCGHITYQRVLWVLGWSSANPCTIRGLPALALDFIFYIPVAISWHRLRHS